MEYYFFRIYESLGAYFTGSERRRIFYIFVLFLFGIVLFVVYRYQIAINPETLFWVFSSIVQSLVALIAFIGVVVIFKYQNILMREDRLMEEMNKPDSALAGLGGELDSISGQELIAKINKHVFDDPSKEGFRAKKLRQVRDELNSIEFIRNFLRENLVKFSVYILATILLNLFLLIFTPFLGEIALLATASLYISIFLTAYAFFLTIKTLAAAFLH